MSKFALVLLVLLWIILMGWRDLMRNRRQAGGHCWQCGAVLGPGWQRVTLHLRARRRKADFCAGCARQRRARWVVLAVAAWAIAVLAWWGAS